MDSGFGTGERMETTRLPGLLRRALLRLLLIASFLGSSSAWAADAKVKFDLRSDEFPKAILEFYHQSKVEVLFLSNDGLRKIKTQPVVGEFEPREALERMLKGTGLTFDFDTDHSVIIKQPQVASAPPPVAPAPPSRTLEPSVHHSAALDSNIGHGAELEQVVVTGSLIRGTAMDVVAPLVYVTKQDLAQAPYATVQDALYQLPISSLDVPREDLSLDNNLNFGSGINLRGLGVGATLVLVNGHRQPLSGANGDFVDVSNIPTAAVERIEILPDGASALYGSDAIAGVVNIVLKDDFQGAETQARYGGAPGGRDEVMVSQLLGTHWDTGKAMFVYEYEDATNLPAAARGYAANADKVPYGGGDYRSYFSDPGNILNPTTLQPAYGIPSLPAGTTLSPSMLSSTINLQNQLAPYELFPQRTSNSVYGTVTQRASEDIELFAEGRFTQRMTHFQSAAEDQILQVPATNPFNPFGTTTLVAYSFLNSLGPVELDSETQNYLGTVGARFRLGPDWQATLSESYGRERLFYNVHNEPDQLALGEALADSNAATAFNAFGGTTNPATVAAIQRAYTLHATSSIETTSLVADGPLFDLHAGAVKLAAGLERREESLDHSVPSPTDPVDEFVNAEYSRHVGSAFAELAVPIIGDAASPRAAPRLELTAAGRYEDYSDFGHTANPEFRLRWIPLDSLKLRASWGRSFRAPTLDNLHDLSSNLSFETVLPDPRSPTGQSTVLGLEGNNPNLKQETAKTWTAGFDVVPQVDPGLKFSLTYYSIDFEGQIAEPAAADVSEILAQESQWASVITRNPTQAQVDAICNRPDFATSRAACLASLPAAIVDFRLANLTSTKVNGLDLDVHQTVNSGLGRFDFGLNGSYVFHFDQAVTDSSPTTDIVNTFGNPLKLRFRATAAWSQHENFGLGANLAVNFTNAYDNPGSTLLPRIDSLTTVDLQLRYRTPVDVGIWSGTELALNAVNIFNQSLPFADTLYGYDVANFQPLGRVLSLSISKKW
jgi:iron complex outermembrane recepter protein